MAVSFGSKLNEGEPVDDIFNEEVGLKSREGGITNEVTDETERTTTKTLVRLQSMGMNWW
jgi:hypothetical protein